MAARKTLNTGKISTFILLAAMALTVNSCTKSAGSSGNDGEKFIGTWTGGSAGSIATLTFVAGGNGNALTTAGTVGGTTGCIKPVTLNITASGNTILIPAQIFTDNCGTSYTITGYGSVSGNTLTFSETIAGGVNTTISFTGTK